MAQHPRSWLRNTLNVWLGYFFTAIVAIPASALGLFLISNGMGRQAAVLISISLAVLGGFTAEQLFALRTRKQSRPVVSATLDTAYQLGWGKPAVTAAGLIAGLSQAALSIPSFEYDSAFSRDTAQAAVARTVSAYQVKTTVSRMFVVTEEQKNVLPVNDRKHLHERKANEPITSEELQRMNAAALAYFEDASV